VLWKSRQGLLVTFAGLLPQKAILVLLDAPKVDTSCGLSPPVIVQPVTHVTARVAYHRRWGDLIMVPIA